jgi:tetratricopeptide (TPR) repeat protein
MIKRNISNQKGQRQSGQASIADPFAAQIELAIQYMNTERLDEAEETYRKILDQDPEHLEANHLLGFLLAKTFYHEHAIEYLEKTIEINKSHTPALFLLSRCLYDLGRMDESVEIMKQFMRLGQKKKIGEKAINLRAGCLHLGQLYMELHRHEEAERWLLRGLRFEPDSVDIQNALCLLYFEQGRSEEVKKIAQRAIETNPGNIVPYRYLVAGRKFLTHDDLMHEMENIYARPDITDPDRLILAFALGKASEDLGKYDQAFDYWTEGNRLRRKISPYEINRTVNKMQAIRKTFNAKLLRTARPVQSTAMTPVFVVGMPRSGTSLVEQILASHSRVAAAGELETLARLGQNAVTRFPDDMSKLDEEQWQHLGADYLKFVTDIVGDAAYIVDKMPRNFMFLGMLRMMLPQAKIIHCRRDRMDTCLSCYKNDLLQEGMGYTCDLADLGLYYRHYESLMAHWQELLSDWIYEVSYESLVADPATEIHRLLDFCDLDHQAGCESFYKTKRIVRTTSALQVRQPVYRDSVDSWKHYDRQLQPLIEALNQPPERGLSALRKQLGF